MKILFTTRFNENYSHLALLVTRILTSAFMLTHGVPKLIRLFSSAEIKFADPFGLGAIPSLILAVFAEFFCSIFIILGLGTRLAAVPLIITMLVAAFYAHANDPFGTKEKPMLFVILYILFLVFGSGKYSLDQWISKNKL
jgi:putative oxidoreductase